MTAVSTPTSAEVEPVIRTLLTRVVAAEDVHGALRRVTLTGPALADLDLPGPDAFFHLLLPPPGRSDLTVDESFSWEAHAATPARDRAVGAYYTVWDHRPDRAELDVLMVLHGDEGDGSAWAARARPGHPVAIWGPRTTFHPPADADRWVLCADETGTPAAGRVLRARPPGMPALLLAETDSPSTRQPLPDTGDAEFRWLYREGAPAGSTTLLEDALAAERLTPDVFVWAAAEHRTVDALREVARTARVARTHRSLLAYWRLPTAR